MHSLGNDFMVIDAINQAARVSSENIIAWSDRNTGIGFDQCLIIQSGTTAGIDFFYRIFNANGQEVGQCGNGARCLARFVWHYGLTHKKAVNIATKTTTMQAFAHDEYNVTLDMGVPVVAEKQCHISIDSTHVDAYTADVGNPHAVILMDDIAFAPIHQLGKQLSEHELFPLQSNVEWMSIDNPNKIRLRVYERGCGETLACGSGAVAAVAVGRRFYQLAPLVEVQLPGGKLTVEWQDYSHSIFLTGSATFVYEGSLL